MRRVNGSRRWAKAVVASSILGFLIVGLLASSANGPGTSPYPHSILTRSNSQSLSRIESRADRTKLALPPRSPTASASDPWPVGIADAGRTSAGTTAYDTTSFLATAAIDSLSTSGSGSVGNEMTFQLNVNLGFEDGGSWYVYWIQDIAWVDTATSTVESFENNIWNFSSSSECMSSSAVEGNGQVYPYSGCVGYYAYAVVPSPELAYPGTFEMTVNSTVNSRGQPAVDFMYNDGAGFVTYDVATFDFVHALDYSDGFIVDGSGYNPTGYLYYDAEFVLGGPGGGSSTTDESSDVNLYLEYWNGNNYETILNAINYGLDTGETIANANSQGYYWDDSGELFSQVTTGSESQSALWYSSSVAIVEIEGPGSCDGLLDSGSVGTGYLYGYGAIAMWPVAVDFKVACDGFTENLGTPSLSSGTTTVLSAGIWVDFNFGQSTLPSGTTWGAKIDSDLQEGSGAIVSFYIPTGSYSFEITGGGGYLPYPSDGEITVSSSGGSQTVLWQQIKVASNSASGSVDVGQSVDFSTSLSDVAGDTFSWHGLPAGCSSANSTSISCQPSSSGTYSVSLSVVEPGGFEAAGPGLSFVVFTDPSAALPTESPGSVDQGQQVTFSTSTSPGSGSDMISWNGLPSGCSDKDASSITCYPTAGSYQVSVTIEDSNGYVVTSGKLHVTVSADPTVTTPVSSVSSLDVGQSVNLSATFTAGSGGDSFSWAGLPPGCSSSDSASITCMPTEPGAYSITISIVDSNGFSSSANVTIRVYSQPSVQSLTASPGTTLAVGQSVTITANVTVGSGGLSYSWNGMPPGCRSVNSPILTCTPSATGTWNVSVTITDSNHGSSTSSGIFLTVRTEFLGLPAIEGYALVAAGIAAIIAVGIVSVILVHRRQRKSSKSTPPTTPSRSM